LLEQILDVLLLVMVLLIKKVCCDVITERVSWYFGNETKDWMNILQ
jgi:hypothetical protein